MKGKNRLIVTENGQLSEISLDNKIIWEVGRPSKDNVPDIKMHSPTVSRKHGRFQNMDGVWFYVDYKGKNGTLRNGKPIGTGLRGRAKPAILKDGDVLVFGGGDKAEVNDKTVWAYYIERGFDDKWRLVDTKGYDKIHFLSDGKETIMINPDKGIIIEKETGIAIYIGNITYATGDMVVFGE